MDNLISNTPKLALDSKKSVTLDYDRFKDRNSWFSISRRSFVVDPRKLGANVSGTGITSILFALVSDDIVILLLFPYEERSIHISSIWSVNAWVPWRKIL